MLVSNSVASFDKCSSRLGDLNDTHFMNIFPLCMSHKNMFGDRHCCSHGNQFRIKNYFVFRVLVFHVLVFHILVFHVLMVLHI